MGLRIELNGRVEELDGLDGGAALAEVVAGLKLQADRVAVERNGWIVPRRDWGGTAVANGDKLEIVHFVGGGLSTPRV